MPSCKTTLYHYRATSMFQCLLNMVHLNSLMWSFPKIFFAIGLKSVYFGFIRPYYTFPFIQTNPCVSCRIPDLLSHLSLIKLAFFCLTAETRPIIFNAQRAVHSLTFLFIASAASFGVLVSFFLNERSWTYTTVFGLVYISIYY